MSLASSDWKLLITPLGAQSDAFEIVVSADNWLDALRAGRKQLQEDGGVPPGASCVMSATGEVTILDAANRRRYQLKRAHDDGRRRPSSRPPSASSSRAAAANPLAGLGTKPSEPAMSRLFAPDPPSARPGPAPEPAAASSPRRNAASSSEPPGGFAAEPSTAANPRASEPPPAARTRASEPPPAASRSSSSASEPAPAAPWPRASDAPAVSRSSTSDSPPAVAPWPRASEPPAAPKPSASEPARPAATRALSEAPFATTPRSPASEPPRPAASVLEPVIPADEPAAAEAPIEVLPAEPSVSPLPARNGAAKSEAGEVRGRAKQTLAYSSERAEALRREYESARAVATPPPPNGPLNESGVGLPRPNLRALLSAESSVPSTAPPPRARPATDPSPATGCFTASSKAVPSAMR